MEPQQQSPLPSEPEQPSPRVHPLWSNKKYKLVVLALVVILVAGASYWFFVRKNDKPVKNSTASQQATATKSTTTASTAHVEGLQLEPQKNYGNKYASGILPVGDNQYSTTGAAKGKVYMCHNNFVPTSQAGAQTRGPWFIGTTQWDINKKYAVRGSVSWKPTMSNVVNGDTRLITTNDLPIHPTGTFPVAQSDPASQYDRNPNTISAQSLSYSLNAKPSYGSPQCMGGEVGVMLTGVSLFNGFDAGGRDAGAWEIQDSCEGHPQGAGQYHYHTLSSCITDVSVSTVVGFALDGFPITGPKVGDNNFLTTNDLDECHGITSEITLDGKKTTTYHYVMTEDFPYSASCFRSKATQPPGQPGGTEKQGSNGTTQQGGTAQQPGAGTGTGQRQLPPPPPTR